MDFNIVVTGRNRKIAKDVCEHLEVDRGYKTFKCNPNKSTIFDLIIEVMPRVVIMCLGDETVGTVQAYNVMKSAVEKGLCTVIVITDSEDEKLFMKYTDLKKMYFLSRPVSLLALYQMLQDIEEDLKERKANNLAPLRLVENEKATNKNRRKTLLVVDDETENLLEIKEQLEEFYDLELTKSVDNAFKRLFKEKPDLILMRMFMKTENALQAQKTLRTFPEYDDIPFVYLVDKNKKDEVVNALPHLKHQGFIIIPAKRSEIVAQIIDIFDKC